MYISVVDEAKESLVHKYYKLTKCIIITNKLFWLCEYSYTDQPRFKISSLDIDSKSLQLEFNTCTCEQSA